MKRVALFVCLLAVVGGAAALLGSLIGTDVQSAKAGEHGMAMSDAADGLSAQSADYSLAFDRTELSLGRQQLHLRIVDRDGRPAGPFDLEGGVRLHLIVVSRDLADYQHVHPHRRADGSWSVSADFVRAGAYRAFADFEVDGVKTVLGRDLFVGGTFEPRPLPRPSLVTHADGYRVALRRTAATFSFHVTRAGRPVAFQTYIGARGHLVALREGDLAYSHVHPLETATAPGTVLFDGELAHPGTYRLFFQFRSGGEVHTARFTVEAAS